MAVLAVLPNLSQAQNMYRYSYNGANIYTNNNVRATKPDSAVFVNKVHTVTHFTQELNKGKAVTLDSSIHVYNTKGIYTETRNYSPKQKLYSKTQLIYDALGREVVKMNEWNKSFFIENNTYLDTLKIPLTTTVTRGRKGKTKYSVFSQNYFNVKNELMESNSITNGDLKRAHHFVYERAYNGNVEKIKVYDYKNKLCYIYNYSCDKNGKLELDQKKMQSTCLLKNRLANGHWQSIQITEHAFGINRAVYEYDSLDRPISKKHYGGKKGEVLKFADSNWVKMDTAYTAYTYYTNTSKGKCIQKQTNLSVLAPNKQYARTITTITNRKNKIIQNSIDYYSYNDKGMISETKVVNLLDKTEYKKFVKYEYFE